MAAINYSKKISLYLKSNPDLAYEDFGTLLLIDNLYGQLPDDINAFRKLYAHLDPKIIDNGAAGIIFLQIAKSKEPTSVIKHRLNNYINMKLNYSRNSKSYQENMKKFKEYSIIVSDIINELLSLAKYPPEITKALKEREAVQNCYDFHEMLLLYRKTNDKRIKYEILRKLGLLVLLARIHRSLLIEDLEFALKEVTYVFKSGLGLTPLKRRKLYLWVDEHDKAKYAVEKRKAFNEYQSAVKKRNMAARSIYSMQIIDYLPFRTKFNSEILHMDIRNKLNKNGELYSTSFVEKVIRKNLEFPNQVHDVIGIKLVVSTEDEIPQLIMDLSTFLGGSSTRKKEKNALYKFGKRELSRYASKDYFVWKAVYDISLPHPSIVQVHRMLKLTQHNPQAQQILSDRIKYFEERPQDFVVEVQIQDINSYLLSSARGSTTDHRVLKTNQVRNNSFYKLFPKEIYQKELARLRNKKLNRI